MNKMMKLALLATVIGVGSLGMASIGVAQDKVLRVGQTAEITSFDPTELRIGSDTSIFLLYNSLLRIESDGTVTPELAESWEWSEDGRELTVSLRQGVVFHDGRPMTSRDVAFSLEYARTPEVGANVLPLARQVEAVETPDDHTVVLRVNGSPHAIIDLLDLVFIIDSTNPDTIKTAANGTGPYRLDSHQPGRSTVFVRNDDYWGDTAQLDRIEVRIVPDTQAAVAQLRSGSIDFLPMASREAIDQIQNESGLMTGVAANEGRVLDMLMNVKSGPTANSQLRQAINMALDRERIAADVVGEGTILKCLPWSELSVEYHVGYEDACRYDLDAARAIIDAEGLAGTQIEILSYAQGVPEISGMAQIVQYSLGQIGLNVSIVDVAPAAVTQRYRASDFELHAHAYARGGRSPATILLTAVPYRPVDNPSGFVSEQYERDVAEVTSAGAGDGSSEAWTRINDFLLSEAWIMPVTSLPLRWASSSRVDNVSFNLDGMVNLSSATIE